MEKRIILTILMSILIFGCSKPKKAPTRAIASFSTTSCTGMVESFFINEKQAKREVEARAYPYELDIFLSQTDENPMSIRRLLTMVRERELEQQTRPWFVNELEKHLKRIFHNWMDSETQVVDEKLLAVFSEKLSKYSRKDQRKVLNMFSQIYSIRKDVWAEIAEGIADQSGARGSTLLQRIFLSADILDSVDGRTVLSHEFQHFQREKKLGALYYLELLFIPNSAIREEKRAHMASYKFIKDIDPKAFNGRTNPGEATLDILSMTEKEYIDHVLSMPCYVRSNKGFNRLSFALDGAVLIIGATSTYIILSD